jgi:hypothetical protein
MDQIKEQFRKMAFKYHPDIKISRDAKSLQELELESELNEKFILIKEAYEVLHNPETNNEIVATMSTASLPKLPPPGCAWIRNFDEPLAQYCGITDALVEAGVISPDCAGACCYDYVTVFAHKLL